MNHAGAGAVFAGFLPFGGRLSSLYIRTGADYQQLQDYAAP